MDCYSAFGKKMRGFSKLEIIDEEEKVSKSQDEIIIYEWNGVNCNKAYEEV